MKLIQALVTSNSKKKKVKALNNKKKRIPRKLKHISRNHLLMQELYRNNNGVKPKTQEPFSPLQIPLHVTAEGQALIQQVIDWTKPENRGADIVRVY